MRGICRRTSSDERYASFAFSNLSTLWSKLGNVPGNALERLRGDRNGQHSIRINDQWRVCFTWLEGVAHDVEVVDYH